MGFTSLDGPNPHESSVPRQQPPQSDGRIPPPLPPRPPAARQATPWHETKIEQGPAPAWASFISAWYGQFWGLCRALLLASLLVVLTPALHVLALLALTAPTRVPILRPLAAIFFQPLFRCVQLLYTGLIVFLFERLGGGRLMFSGRVTNQFWDGATDTTDAGAAPRVTVCMANQTSYTSSLDVLVFFSLAYRRAAQRSNLYFLPVDKRGWNLVDVVLHVMFLAPLTIDSVETVDLLLSYGAPVSFVWFPESTDTSDETKLVDGLVEETVNADLLHVRHPRLSRIFTHIVDTTVNRGIGNSLCLLDCTLAYSGSVQADLAQQHADTVSNAFDGALDSHEQDDFEKIVEKDWTEDAADDADDEADGYSAETINIGAHGSITTRPRRPFEPSMPVFCTAAPLRPFDATTSATRHASDVSFGRSVTSPQSRAALLRERVVPTFYAFLSGNAPSRTHVLLQQYDDAYIRARVVPPQTSANGAQRTVRHLTAAEESNGSSSSDAASLALARSLSSWLQHCFLRTEQQLSLFGVHACFHLLPASLSASSIPISKPLESYTHPVSGVRLALFAVVDWVIIVFGTIALRNGRAWYLYAEE